MTPAELAKEWGCSERRVRQMARRLGACRIIGKTMLLTPEDEAALLEAFPFKPRDPFYSCCVAASGHAPWVDARTLSCFDGRRATRLSRCR